MPFQCQLCEKVLPTRTGIWNHLKNKHPEVAENQQDGEQLLKRRKLDKYIICKDPVKPVQSQPGRPVDDSIELTKKIKLKSESNNEDISLKTMMNSYAQQVLWNVSLIEENDLKKYIRDPNQEYRPQNLDIKDEMPIQQQKLNQFLNRIRVIFNREINTKIEEISLNLEKIAEIQNSDEHPLIKQIFYQAHQYSLCI